MTPDLLDDAFWDEPAPEPVAPRPGRRSKAEKIAERVETRGRSRALQALYAADVRDFGQLRRIASNVFDDLAVDAGEREFAWKIVATLADSGA